MIMHIFTSFSPWGGWWSFWEGWAQRQDFPAAQQSTAGVPVCPSHPLVVLGPTSPAAERELAPAACGRGPESPLCLGRWSGLPPWPESLVLCGPSKMVKRSEPSWPLCTAESADSCGSPCCVGGDVCEGRMCYFKPLSYGEYRYKFLRFDSILTFREECEPSSQRHHHSAGWGWPHPTAGSCCSSSGQSRSTHWEIAPSAGKKDTYMLEGQRAGKEESYMFKFSDLYDL